MSNQAAYLPSKQAKLIVKDATLEKPGPNEVLIRNHAVAINPVDTKIQDSGFLIEEYPFILGLEVAGEVEEVGEEVTRFKKGDRVVGLATAVRNKKLSHGAFQNFTMAIEPVVAHIPSSIPYTSAVVLPLALATAAAGLFEPMYLGLPAPVPSEANGLSGKAILIWGGSAAVGSCAIQLAKALGLTVLTTASKKNHDYVRELGAKYVFDHKDVDVVGKMIATVGDMNVVGAYDVIGDKETSEESARLLHHFGGGTLLTTRPGQIATDTLLGDVEVLVVHPPEGPGIPVWMKVWDGFISEGLKDGRLKVKPDPIVIQGGLSQCQNALDTYRRGVSAGKVVVEL